MITVPKADPDFAVNPYHGEFAQHRFLRAVLPHAPRRGMAVDVGAHVGLWTRMLADKFSQVTAFEPVAENFACLLENTGHLKNVTLENIALGAVPGVCAMTKPPQGNSGCWRVDGGVGTELRTLDGYKLNHVDLIKIDVEGLEGDVLAGARETLMRWRPAVVFEDNGLGVEYYGLAWTNPTFVLESLRYRQAARYAKNECWVPC